MNTRDNRRYRDYESKIQTAFIRLLNDQPPLKITVSDICKEAKINRTTFYAHYPDVCNLLSKMVVSLRRAQVSSLNFCQGTDGLARDRLLLQFLCHIKENRKVYQAYFQYGNALFSECDSLRFWTETAAQHPQKNCSTENRLLYHSEFCRAGFHAVIRQWIERGCAERPEDIVYVLQSNTNLSMGRNDQWNGGKPR